MLFAWGGIHRCGLDRDDWLSISYDYIILVLHFFYKCNINYVAMTTPLSVMLCIPDAACTGSAPTTQLQVKQVVADGL